MTKSILQTTLNRLKKNHDPDVRAVIDMMENVVAERDALQFKYEVLLHRFEELENAFNNQSGRSAPTSRRQKTKRDNANTSTIRQTYDGDCGH